MIGKLRKKSGFVGVFLVLFLSSIAGAESRPRLELAQGEQRLLRLPGLRKYSLGSDVVRVLPRRGVLPADTLMLKAVRPGFGDLMVWKDDGSIEHRIVSVNAVAPRQPGTSASHTLDQGLSRLEEVEVLREGGGVTIRGEIQTTAEAVRVASLRRAFPELVQDEAVLAPLLLKLARERLATVLADEGLHDRVAIDATGARLRLSGSLPSPASAAAIERRVRAAFSLVDLDLRALPDGAPTVHFKVYLLEMKRSRLRSWGLNWPAVLENAVRLSASTGAVALQAGGELGASLQMLEGTGEARILSQPELVVRAPGTAELFAGGELPVETRTKNTSQVNWKSFGLSLKIKVTHSTAERARLDVQTELSQLDAAIGASEIPGVSANRMSTQVDADYGKPLLLSGLIQEGSRLQARGIPGLRRIPVLGALFGSEDYQQNRSELVAILLPSARPPAPDLRKLDGRFPRGQLPIPREWISEEDAERLRASPDYPWNALE